MRYWKELYVSEELKGREEEIIEHLEKKEFQFRVYLKEINWKYTIAGC